MDDLLDLIYAKYDYWSRLWTFGLMGICVHWGIMPTLKTSPGFMSWYALMLIITFALLCLLIARFYDILYLESNKKHTLQKYLMFFSGPLLFLANWLAFFVLIDELIDQMPFSMAEWCFLLTVSLYNIYSFLLIHYSNVIREKTSFLEALN